MFRRLLSKISGGAGQSGNERSGETILHPGELERIGTEEDPMRNYEVAFERDFEAMEAEQQGDVERAIELYELCVADGYVKSHPYERLADLYERRRAYADALRILEAFIGLAKSGRIPRGAQRSADRKLPEIESKAGRLRRMARADRSRSFSFGMTRFDSSVEQARRR